MKPGMMEPVQHAINVLHAGSPDRGYFLLVLEIAVRRMLNEANDEEREKLLEQIIASYLQFRSPEDGDRRFVRTHLHD